MARVRLVRQTLTAAVVLLLRTVLPASAQYAPSPPSDPPDCDDWKAGNLSFLQSATAEDIGLCLESGADVHIRDGRGRTPLHIAVGHTEDIAVVTTLLAAGADASARDWTGATPLHAAAGRNANLDIALLLAEAGADINARDGKRNTSLHSAWSNPNPAVVPALLGLGADPLARNQRGNLADPQHCSNWNTPVFARMAAAETVAGCIESGADRHARDDDGNTPLHHAAQGESVANVVLLLQHGVEVDIRNGDGRTPLHFAALSENPAVAAALLETGAEVNALDDDPTPRTPEPSIVRLQALGLLDRQPPTARTPLHYAASNTNPAVAAALIEAGASVNPSDADGRTPLHHAAANENAPVVTMLLEAGASVDARDNRGATPLLLLAGDVTGLGHPGFQSRAALNALLGAGADVTARGGFYETTALHYAVQLARNDPPTALGIVGMLLRAGADPNAPNEHGNTPLHLASDIKSEPMVRALLDAGGNVSVRNAYGATPLHLAGRDRFDPVDADAVAALLAAGADLNQWDSTGHTPLHYAVGTPSASPWSSEARLGTDPRPAVNPAVAVLLASGAEASLPNNAGRTPLHQAVAADNSAHVVALLRAGADAHARDSGGNTPLHGVAALPERPGPKAMSLRYDTAMVTALVGAGADVNARNDMGETALHLATRAYNPLVIDRLLELGADPDIADDRGRLAGPAICDWPDARFFAGAPPNIAERYYAAPPESVRGCLDAGADANARDEYGNTPLHNLAIANSGFVADVIALLVEAGADVNARNHAGATPFHVALADVRERDANAIALLDAGADFDIDGDGGETAARTAKKWSFITRYGFGEVTRTPFMRKLLELGMDPALLDNAPDSSDPTSCDNWFTSAFFTSATLEAVAGCIDSGADANARSVDWSEIQLPVGSTPLHAAAGWAIDPAVISLLVDAGAEVNVADEEGYFPLHRAAQRGTPAVVRALLDAGADVDAWAKGYGVDAGWDYTPLHEAVGENRNLEVAATLLRAGANVNAWGESGRTPLHRAAAGHPDPAAIRLLLEAGAEVNARGTLGRTPLHEAANWNNPAVVTALLEAGAAPGLQGSNTEASALRGYFTPAALAALYGKADVIAAMIAFAVDVPLDHAPTPAIVEMLVSAGADVNERGILGRTHLHVAARSRPSLFPILLQLGGDPTVPDDWGRTPLDYARENRALQGLEIVRRLNEAWRRPGTLRDPRP